TISVKIPIAWDRLTKRSKQRLRQIVGRDTRIIKAYLGIIQTHERSLILGKQRNRIDESKLHSTTLTATRSKSKRVTVEHDMKSRFPRTSQNEFTECRKTAVALYESYLTLRGRKGKGVSHPCTRASSRRIPRWTFAPQVFRLVENKTNVARWWMNLRNALDSSRMGKTTHQRLLIPLKVAPFHENQLTRGKVKAAQMFTDRDGKWWVTIAVRVNKETVPEETLPPAVLGIDLGIEKAACSVLVTPGKVRETRFFNQHEKVQLLRRYDERVATLNHIRDTNRNTGKRHDNVTGTLKSIRTKRENLARQYDRVLVRQILDYVSELSERYTLYIAIGRLKYIRNVARRGNQRGPRFRRLIHSWAFSRITTSLKHQLAQMGWSVEGKGSRFQAVPESWTSITCWKCGNRGARPGQNLFVCPTCGNKCNADQNGAINIAGRIITLTKSLHSVRGLGKWASAVARSKRPKAQGRKSRRRSLLSKQELLSDSGESAVVHHTQMSLLNFSDGVEMGDDDHAVVRTVKALSAVGIDGPTSKQEKEARSEGGIPSQ
ncbi:MAG: zinc ribbon domain-containing protein, partial [Candidatus Thorarchaeota archaeon]